MNLFYHSTPALHSLCFESCEESHSAVRVTTRHGLDEDAMARLLAATRAKRLEFALARLHLSALEKTLAGCCKQDLPTREVFEAVTFLENRSAIKWPFDQFREALGNRVEAHRQQHLNVSLNAIRRVLGPDLSGHFSPR